MTFRDDRPECLACAAGLEKRGARWFCGQCLSKLLPASELQDALNEVSPDDWRELDQRLIPSTRASRMCPLCRTTMTTWSIYDVPLDRCGEHGIWIDRSGDATVILANEASYNARHPSVPRGAWFPMGLGIIVGAVLSPWLDRRRLRKDIRRSSPSRSRK